MTVTNYPSDTEPRPTPKLTSFDQLDVEAIYAKWNRPRRSAAAPVKALEE